MPDKIKILKKWPDIHMERNLSYKPL